MSETLNWVATGVSEVGHRHQAIAERVRADSQNSQRGAVGFGAEPQYYKQGAWLSCGKASARHTYVPSLGKYRRCVARAGEPVE